MDGKQGSGESMESNDETCYKLNVIDMFYILSVSYTLIPYTSSFTFTYYYTVRQYYVITF